MEKIVYFDHSATTSVKKEVLDEMLPFFSKYYGNASGTYNLGIKSRETVETSREKIADLINADYTHEIYFTSCGSESDNMVIRGIALANKDLGRHIITTKIEHKAILNTCKELEKEGFEVTYLDVDEEGFVRLNDIKNAIRNDTILISVMLANNEIGTIQNISSIGKLARFKGIYFHTDAVQAIGNVEINVKEMSIDAMSFSAHKFYGPKGVGGVYIRKGIKFTPLINGGGQENSKRAGTENVAGIVGMTKAFEIAVKNIKDYNKKLLELRTYLIEKLKDNFKDLKINGSLESRLPGNLNFYIKGINGKEIITLLGMENICVSGGSACNKGAPSYVLKAIGKSDEISSNSIRVTFGDENTKEDVDYFVDSLIKNIKNLP